MTFGKIPAAIELARLAGQVTEAEIEITRLDTALAAAEAYYGLLTACEQVRTLEVEQQAREEALAVVQARYDIGDATRLELNQAQAALAEVRPVMATARGGAEVAEIRLWAVLGVQPDERVEIRSLEVDPPPPPDNALLARAGWRGRPELKALELERGTRRRQETVIAAEGTTDRPGGALGAAGPSHREPGRPPLRRLADRRGLVVVAAQWRATARSAGTGSIRAAPTGPATVRHRPAHGAGI